MVSKTISRLNIWSFRITGKLPWKLGLISWHFPQLACEEFANFGQDIVHVHVCFGES